MSRRARLEAMLAEDPADAFLNYALALDDLTAGRRSEAERGLRHVLVLDPTYVAAYQQLGQMFFAAGDWPEASTFLEQGIAAARQAGNAHAAQEMQGLRDQVPG